MKMLSRRQLLSAATFVSASAVTGACSQPKSSGPPRNDKVTYVTALGLTGREGFAHVAAAKGYFAEVGIEATITPGRAGDYNLQQMLGGNVHFGSIDYSGALIRVGNGAFTPFRCIATLNNKTTFAIMTYHDRGISSPTDLKGKLIAQTTGSAIKRVFPGYAKEAGLDPATVKFIDVDANNLYSALAARKVDAIGNVVVAAPVIAAAANRPVSDVVTMPYSNYLLDLYGIVLVTTAKLSKENPDLCRRFTGALLRGLEYMVNNVDESAAILRKAVKETNLVSAKGEMELLRPYVSNAASGTPLGAFDPAKVARSVAAMKTLDLMPPASQPDLDTFVDFSVVAGGSPLAVPGSRR
jgi:NitT/TauT family transport system substrate-binding protein